VTVGAFVGLITAYLLWKWGIPRIDKYLGKFLA